MRYQMRDLLVSLPGLRRTAALDMEVASIEDPTETECADGTGGCGDEFTGGCQNQATEECDIGTCLGGTQCDGGTMGCICSDCFQDPMGAFTFCDGDSVCQVATDPCQGGSQCQGNSVCHIASGLCLKVLSEGGPCMNLSHPTMCDVDGDPSRQACVPLSQVTLPSNGGFHCIITDCADEPCDDGGTIDCGETCGETCGDTACDGSVICDGSVDCGVTAGCGATDQPGGGGVAQMRVNARSLALAQMQQALRRKLGRP